MAQSKSKKKTTSKPAARKAAPASKKAGVRKPTSKAATAKKTSAKKTSAKAKKIAKVIPRPGGLLPAQIVPGWFRIFQTAVGANPSSGYYEVGRLNVVALTGGRTVETYFMHTANSGALRRYEPTGTYAGGVDRRVDHWRFNMFPAGTGGAPVGVPYNVYECNCAAPYAGP